jgi:glutaredoxin
MSQPAVVMYTTSWCPYCARARRVLAAKNVSIEEIDVESAPARRTEMQNRSGPAHEQGPKGCELIRRADCGQRKRRRGTEVSLQGSVYRRVDSGTSARIR